MMQRLVLFLLFVAVSGPLHAQNEGALPSSAKLTTTDPIARAATDLLVAKYSLDADQAQTMYTIQARKQRNLKQVEALKTSNPTGYTTKVKHVQEGALNSIRRMLRTKEQVALYDKTKRAIRDQRAAKRKALLAQGMPTAAIEAALLEIYAE